MKQYLKYEIRGDGRLKETKDTRAAALTTGRRLARAHGVVTIVESFHEQDGKRIGEPQTVALWRNGEREV